MTTITNIRGFDIPADLLIPPVVTFEEIVQTIKDAPRPVTLAEVAYHLTGNPHYQHYLNPKFSGEKHERMRDEAGLYIAYKKGRACYWAVLEESK